MSEVCFVTLPRFCFTGAHTSHHMHKLDPSCTNAVGLCSFLISLSYKTYTQELSLKTLGS